MVWLWGLVWVGGTITVAIAGALLVRRRFPAHVLARHNDVAGFIYAVLGVIYAVLLGFLVITVWDEYADADMAAAHEAAEVGDLYRDASALDPHLGQALQGHLRQYTSSTVASWSTRADTGADVAALRALWQDLAAFEPQTPAQQVWYAEVLSRMNDLASYRTLRRHAANSALPGLMWGVLIAGAIIVIGFSYLFGTPNQGAHSYMVAALAAAIGLVLFAIFAMDHPFRGVVRVTPTAFEQLEPLFQGGTDLEMPKPGS